MNPIVQMYLDWFNNFLTVGAFADYYCISQELAEQIIREGSELHELSVGIR